MVKNITLKFTLVYSIQVEERVEVLAGIKRWLDETSVIFNIARQFELKNIVLAHELVESGNKVGHVVLTIPN
jgi:hypothetical protein